MQRASFGELLAAILGMLAPFAVADVVTIVASTDNTLYEDETGDFSNGKGEFLFVGRVAPRGGELLRRAVLAFDIAGNVPAGATINSVSLTLHVSQTIAGPEPAELHRLLADWGEGTSNAGAPGGIGAPSTPGDATWIHRFFDDQPWSTPGGDFLPEDSASEAAGDIGSSVLWSTPEMAADVQWWLDAPSENFGWIIIGNEAVHTTAKRFDSRENFDPATRPTLSIDFTTPPPTVPTASGWGIVIMVGLLAGAVAIATGRNRPWLNL